MRQQTAHAVSDEGTFFSPASCH